MNVDILLFIQRIRTQKGPVDLGSEPDWVKFDWYIHATVRQRTFASGIFVLTLRTPMIMGLRLPENDFTFEETILTT